MRVSELITKLVAHGPADPEVICAGYALDSVELDPDNGRLHLCIGSYVGCVVSPPAEPEQAEPEQAEPLTLEQRVEALEKRLSDYGLTDFIADSLDYDELAKSCVDYINLREVARCVDMCDLVAEIDLSDIASNIYMSDLASEIDLSDLAGYVDTEEVAGYMNLTDTVRDILTTTRFRLDSSTD
jgi:hypothetical protein